MPQFDAKTQYFAVVDSDGSSTRNLSSYLTSIEGLPGERELVDTSKIGDSGHTFTPSLQNAPFSVDGIYNNENNGIHAVLANLRAMSTATTFAYGPSGNSTGASPASVRISGSCWLRSYVITGRVGSAVSFRAQFQSEGVVSIGTFT